jgi:type IV pilus assembly protein PilW
MRCGDMGRKAAGFSLVELMVGMVLGLMLIAGAVSIYLASKRSYVEVEQVAAVTENARFAEQIVGDALRHMGFLGAVTPNRVEVQPGLAGSPPTGDCSGDAAAYDLTRLAFAGSTDGSNNALGGCISDAFEPSGGPRNDVLVIKHVLPRPYFDTSRVPDPNTPRSGIINTPGPLQNGKAYVMTNNIRGLLFDGSTPPSITTGGEFPDGNAWEYQYEIFYVQDDDPADNDNPPRLRRRVLTYDSSSAAMVFQEEDLAEGVERLRVLLGYDSDNDGDVDTYEDVADVASSNNWEAVESVEVYMLVRSATPDVQYTDTKTYRLGDVSVGPFNDNYRRLISSTSISLRNMKLMIRGNAS